MTQEFKDKWLNALRDGSYTQAKNTLRVKDDEGERFCCLGVMCDLVDKSKWRVSDGSGNAEYFGWDESEESGIPYDITDELNEKAHQLAKMNDTGSTFTEIADWIEENIPVTEQ